MTFCKIMIGREDQLRLRAYILTQLTLTHNVFRKTKMTTTNQNFIQRLFFENTNDTEAILQSFNKVLKQVIRYRRSIQGKFKLEINCEGNTRSLSLMHDFSKYVADHNFGHFIECLLQVILNKFWMPASKCFASA